MSEPSQAKIPTVMPYFDLYSSDWNWVAPNHRLFQSSSSGRFESHRTTGFTNRAFNLPHSKFPGSDDDGHGIGNGIMLPNGKIQISFTATPVGRCDPFKHIALRSIL